MLRIRARHIQLADLETAQQVMQFWQDGQPFEQLATTYSQCPTAIQGGDLGEFGPGHMPPELDAVFLGGDVGSVYGPVASARGFHLIEILGRTE
ncbi:peptidylprolyl isomerase [Stieleria sp. TO1_6]|uniref:peptidylprolyl isomerase n=1 Tax=Stieleria tagensis TaxID=2956795 RepID=UPI00209B3136|nr:peptidylprolyl isomerase [Stieleria tagensis]MCO8120425.1 peptidylprolyl isomerase [Stieleria tagensis]